MGPRDIFEGSSPEFRAGAVAENRKTPTKRLGLIHVIEFDELPGISRRFSRGIPAFRLEIDGAIQQAPQRRRQLTVIYGTARGRRKGPSAAGKPLSGVLNISSRTGIRIHCGTQTVLERHQSSQTGYFVPCDSFRR